MGKTATKHETLVDKALRVIKENKLTTVSEVVTFIDISRSILYSEAYKDTLNSIQEALEHERVKRKHNYKRVWADERAAPVLQIAGFKLVADADELERLTVTNANSKVQQEVQIEWKEGRTYTDKLIEDSEVIQVIQAELPPINPDMVE